jgi:CoA:oxalate CoA-transferase
VSNEILGGVRVLDFTTIVSGPHCTRLLADLGAEVIKIEPPEGDFNRWQPPLRAGTSAYFAHLNCGERSLAIDLRQPEAVELVRELAVKSDVIVENSRPGVMQRLGLDYATLAPLNGRLVYCSIGQKGPWATRSAYAPMLHAASGFDLVDLSYQNGIERPLNTGIYVGDVLGGSYAFGAIQSALLARERSGRGDFIDLSMFDGVLGMLVYEFQEAQFPQKKPANTIQPTRAKDGFVMIAAVKPNNFEALARAVGHPEWMADSPLRHRQKQKRELGHLHVHARPMDFNSNSRRVRDSSHQGRRSLLAILHGPRSAPTTTFRAARWLQPHRRRRRTTAGTESGVQI